MDRPTTTPKLDPSADVLHYDVRQLGAIMAPKSVAVIGASEKAGSVGRTIVWNLLSSPFGGTVFPVNPKRASIVFYVSDIARTEKFYNEALGLALQRQEGAEPFWLSGTLEHGLELVFFEMDGVRGNTPALVFTVDGGGIDDIVAALAEKGVTIVTPVSEAPGGWSAASSRW